MPAKDKRRKVGRPKGSVDRVKRTTTHTNCKHTKEGINPQDFLWKVYCKMRRVKKYLGRMR